MKFFALLASQNTIHVVADRMELDKENNMIFVYDGNRLVVALDVGTVIVANFHE